MDIQNFIIDIIEKEKQTYLDISRKIWDYAELAYDEVESSSALMDALRREGFKITPKAAGLPTAFLGEAGKGKPVIAFLGEYDALDTLSQEADIPRRSPIREGGAGHGCGHHVLGVGALAAAVATKHYLEETKTEGTVRYYGCPAEEGGAGKVLMAREGLFNDVDAAITWHPTSYNSIWSCNFLATRSVKFSFRGVSAHSTMQGHLGRSALEAVELTNVGSNYLRGHVEKDVFINYAVLDAGGTAPNIVPDHGSVIYLLRAATQQHVHNTALRLYDIARGAALMTGTSLEISVESGLSELIPNRSLERIMHDKFLWVGLIPPSDDDIRFAAEIHNTFPENAEESTFENLRYLYGKTAEEIIPKIKGKLIEDIIYPFVPIPHPKYGSTDVCDVSWFTPTAQLTAACYAKDTPGHSWQIVAQGKRELCMNGTLTAAKVMSLTAVELFENANSLKKVRDEFSGAVKGKTYICPIPEQKVFN